MLIKNVKKKLKMAEKYFEDLEKSSNLAKLFDIWRDKRDEC
jgi:hypothetical protein